MYIHVMCIDISISISISISITIYIYMFYYSSAQGAKVDRRPALGPRLLRRAAAGGGKADAAGELPSAAPGCGAGGAVGRDARRAVVCAEQWGRQRGGSM